MKFAHFFLFMALMAPVALGMSLGGNSNAENEDNDAEWLNLLSQSRFEKRKFAPSDPRSLFNAVYSNYK